MRFSCIEEEEPGFAHHVCTVCGAACALDFRQIDRHVRTGTRALNTHGLASAGLA